MLMPEYFTPKNSFFLVLSDGDARDLYDVLANMTLSFNSDPELIELRYQLEKYVSED